MAVQIDPNINLLAQKDILELDTKITKFRSGEIADERFRAFRLTRGVYGQRQQGVQMIRIKLPYGKVTANQLLKICDVSDKYSTGVLHLTTRQDIQIHFVKLEDTPSVWNDLETANITLREACGNTVRNVTASPTAGIDRDELFDVTPYTHAFFAYFLRNPICQDMGRKFKVSFSSSEKDTAFSYIHDLGFIPKIKNGKKGFKVMIGGGLGAQPFLAQVAHEFLPTEQLIPFSEAVIRVFDRYGERTRRHKARMKYLVSEMGLEEFMKLVEEEQIALKSKVYPIDENAFPNGSDFKIKTVPTVEPSDKVKFEEWKKTNVYAQKQKGAFAVNIRIRIGNIPTDIARKFATIISEVAADDIRVTVNQGLTIKFIPENGLAYVFNKLDEIGFAEPGFDSTTDITTCPGTDTCNLGIASSYGITHILEDMMKNEFHELVYNNDIKVKISGCMNSCGQHGMANIGLHGSSIKSGELVMPAMQLLLGGGVLGDGAGTVGEKVIKLPTKRIPNAFRTLFADYEANAKDGEYYNMYYLRQGKNYFYQLLKPLAEVKEPTQDMFIDWGHSELFTTEVGVGECAGVMIDLVHTLLLETEDKLAKAKETLEQRNYADSIYHSYAVFISVAKALLTSKEVSTNSQHGIMGDFDRNFVDNGEISFGKSFKELVLAINKNEPTADFAVAYFAEAKNFLNTAFEIRKKAQLTSIASKVMEGAEG
ncbi:MAG: HEPN domain-containing protein [Bacteroidetes bacterium]|nr:MAG: HEPN domain-containing protein [Bacteroidota bacterium]